jgi:phosphoenolpyruvate carboxykinase (GTP)
MDRSWLTTFSMFCTYAGNTLLLKKGNHRFAVDLATYYKKGEELSEHMFLTGLAGPGGRKTYFAGAYPSACGKTATAMIPGEQIVGDDIVYFKNIDGEFRGVNVEQGIFGIIKDVNANDDPVIYENAMKNQEVIFSNILQGPDKMPYWLGQGVDAPKEGLNHFGEWKEGIKDSKGNEVLIAHPNSRYTMRLDYLENFDKEGFDKTDGVKVQGILYGGRDSNTTVPVEESPSWKDGILLKACTLESETTAATLGKAGVRAASPMANMDFVSYPLGEYTINNIKFVEGMKEVPKIYSTNYFMKSADGDFMTSKLAKKVWLHWAEGRINNEYEALDTPTGKIPLYRDIKALFEELLPEEVLSEEDYTYLFTFRTDKWIAKLERTKEFFASKDSNLPAELNTYWDETIVRLKDIQSKYGNEIKPGDYKG